MLTSAWKFWKTFPTSDTVRKEFVSAVSGSTAGRLFSFFTFLSCARDDHSAAVPSAMAVVSSDRATADMRRQAREAAHLLAHGGRAAN